MGSKWSGGVLRWVVDPDGYELVETADYDKRPFQSRQSLIDLALFALIKKERESNNGKALCLRPIGYDAKRGRGFTQDGKFDVPERNEQIYDPMKRLGLFRQFAKLNERDPQALISFANKNGLLRTTFGAEPVDQWCCTINGFRNLTWAYDRASSPTARAIRELEDRHKSMEADLPSLAPSVAPLIAHTLGTPVATAELVLKNSLPFTDSYSSLVESALAEVRLQVNTSLEGAASPFLVPAGGDSPGVEGIAFIPHDLLAAMWLQFALQIAGMRKRQTCQHCGRAFWLKNTDSGGRQRSQRSDTKYCSSACNTAAYRKRRKQAAQDNPQAAQ